MNDTNVNGTNGTVNDTDTNGTNTNNTNANGADTDGGAVVVMWWMASAMLAKTLLTAWKTAWMTRPETIITVTQRITVQDNG